MTDCQHGFRARRSCETQLFFTLAHELLSSLDVGCQHDLIILDLSKAFDRVPHERLLKKLDHYGIRDSTHGWIKAFLSNRTQQVIVEGATSDTVPVISGVPQGTVIGPLLFLIFINDLPNCVQSRIRLFADDCILYRKIRSIKDTIILQDDLNKLAFRFVLFRFGKFRCVSFHFVPFWYISFRVSFRILQVPLINW